MPLQPKLQQRAAVPYLALSCQVTEQGVAAAVDTAFPELFRWLGKQGVEAAGPPFIRYLEVDLHGDPRELKVGVPVADDVSGDGRVHADALPAGRYVTLLCLITQSCNATRAVSAGGRPVRFEARKLVRPLGIPLWKAKR